MTAAYQFDLASEAIRLNRDAIRRIMLDPDTPENRRLFVILADTQEELFRRRDALLSEGARQ